MIEESKLPKGWEVKKLGEVCDIQTGKHDANHASSKGEFRFYTCAFEFMFCDTKRFNGENLILPGNGANVGEVFYYNGEFDAYQRTYVLNKIKTLPKFLYYHMLCHWKKRNHDKQFGSATNYIRMANFTDYKIAFPPLIEQQKIVTKIEELFSQLENGKQQLLTAQKQLKTYRQSLLKSAFEGKLTNPNLKDGELPKDWEVKKLGDVCKKVETVKRKEKDPEEELFYLDIGGIDNEANKILNHKVYRWKDAPSRAQQVVFMGDILFSTVRTYMKNIALIKNKIFNGQIASSGFCVIRGREKIVDPEYIFYYSLSQKFLQPLNELQTGSSYPAVRDKDVFLQPIPLCTPKEQEKIVTILESKLTICDKIEETIKTSLQQSETLRQSILKKAFEGRLV